MDISKIRYGDRFSLDVPEAELSDEGQYEILTFLSAVTSRQITPENLPHDWSWAPKVTHGTYAGSMSKRIQSWVFKTYKVKLPDEYVSHIGNIANQHTLSARTFIFDFDNKLNWKQGEFGDNKSCFWTDKPLALPTLRHFGGFSMRLYNARGKGVGRCLILPYLKRGNGYQPDRWGEPDALMVFNGYGNFSDQYTEVSVSGQHYGRAQTLDYGRLLALYLGVSYQRIRLTVNGQTDRPMYINNEGNTIMVGPVDEIAPYKAKGVGRSKEYVYLNIDWPRTELEQVAPLCTFCGSMCAFHPEEYLPASLRKARRGKDDKVYCDRCYKSVFVHCYVCHDELDSRVAKVAVSQTLREFQQTTGDHIYLCDRHADEYTFTCSYCRQVYATADRRYYHVPHGSDTPRRVACCEGCYHSQHVRPCPTCTREYASKQLMSRPSTAEETRGHRSMVECPSCRRRSRELLPPEEVVAYLPISPFSASRSSFGVIDDVCRRILNRPNPSRNDPQTPLAPATKEELRGEAKMVMAMRWEPAPGRNHYSMVLSNTGQTVLASDIAYEFQYQLQRAGASNIEVLSANMGTGATTTHTAWATTVWVPNLPGIHEGTLWDVGQYLVHASDTGELYDFPVHLSFSLLSRRPNDALAIERFVQELLLELGVFGADELPDIEVNLAAGNIVFREIQEIQREQEAA